jgi:hypothetical protein
MTNMNWRRSSALSGPGSPYMSLAILPQTISSNNPVDANKTAVLFRNRVPVNPTVATVTITRTDCCPRADGGRLRIIHGVRKA